MLADSIYKLAAQPDLQDCQQNSLLHKKLGERSDLIEANYMRSSAISTRMHVTPHMVIHYKPNTTQYDTKKISKLPARSSLIYEPPSICILHRKYLILAYAYRTMPN